MEKAEEDGTISLSALRRAAAAMDCDVAYFLLPKGSLEATVRARAQALAAQMARRVDDSMTLEAQTVGKKFQAQKAEELTVELIRTLDHGIWNQLDETDLPGRGHSA
jgi:predicted DNA-binding mobile mystery protein A